MSATTDPNGLDLSAAFGPIYWGTVISLVLGGICVIQGYIYFLHAHDRLGIQLIAGSMLVFDITSSALVAQSVYYYLVPHFGSLVPLNSFTPELSGECLLSTVITFISQLYFAAQIFAVTKTGKGSWIVPMAVAIFAVLTFVFGVDVLGNRNATFSIFFGVARGFGALTDVIATIAMCKLLSSAKTGIIQTNSLLKTLITFIVHRGALVTLIQTLLLITFYAAPLHLYWVAFHINVTKLYVNTFFAILNARGCVKQKHSVMASYMGTQGISNCDNKNVFATSDPSADGIVCPGNEGRVYNMTPMPTITKTVVLSDI